MWHFDVQAAAARAAQADREAAQRQEEEKALALKQQLEEAERSRLAEEVKRQEEANQQVIHLTSSASYLPSWPYSPNPAFLDLLSCPSQSAPLSF